MKSKGFCLALVCVSIEFIDFIFFWLVYEHTLKEKQRKIFKNKQQKKEAKKQNKINKNKTHTKSKR